ncbi:GAF and ANTAR domain-containing protein [Nocardioides mesophilus]|uniref:GAF and ANTAR domain-containing protein n=1 Tax=Nocardioides mesophilus TaxID=433659 RepID=A0A7G9R933_9ACTN|nr:GAF and ANTAR domain-containing protein [Nocardioides mesophilus]QNN52108.1 GAF and ANTAR domain-containing protein [Nocardioides mesophilus]
MIAAERLAEVFVEVADTLIDDFDLIEFLQMLATHTSDLFDARAAGLLLADHRGKLQVMAASDERSEMIELFQVQAQEGPCQDCFTKGEAVINADLKDATDRWPNFAPRAVAAGYRSVHAFPLRLRTQTYGALNLFGTHTGQMDPADAKIVQALADIATIGMLQQRTIQRSDDLTEQLQGALNTRIVIEQAKGMIAQTHTITPDQAFEMLRAYCRKNNLPLSDVANRVISDPLSLDQLMNPG